MIAHIPDLCCQQYLTGAEFTLMFDAVVNMRKQQKGSIVLCRCIKDLYTSYQQKAKCSDGSYRNRRVAGLLTWEGDDTPEVR
jgi:hypothetical protein